MDNNSPLNEDSLELYDKEKLRLIGEKIGTEIKIEMDKFAGYILCKRAPRSSGFPKGRWVHLNAPRDTEKGAVDAVYFHLFKTDKV